MDFKWLPGKVGQAVIVSVPVPPSPPPSAAVLEVPTGIAPNAPAAPDAPAAPSAPDAPPAKSITGIVVKPSVDTALRGAHSTWEGALAALIVGALTLIGVHLPLGAVIIITGLLTGVAAVARSILARKTGAKAKAV